jgi:septal ring factor EnvC (AmiA/AmiB activator)
LDLGKELESFVSNFEKLDKKLKEAQNEKKELLQQVTRLNHKKTQLEEQL